MAAHVAIRRAQLGMPPSPQPVAILASLPHPGLAQALGEHAAAILREKASIAAPSGGSLRANTFISNQ